MAFCGTIFAMGLVPVAQLDRALVSEAEGRVFESRQAHFLRRFYECYIYGVDCRFDLCSRVFCSHDFAEIKKYGALGRKCEAAGKN